jgi:RNA polymerase sigma factor (sigma-70 family)
MTPNSANPCAAYATDAQLLDALRRAIRAAQRCLYQTAQRLIIPSLHQKGIDWHDAEDAFQEAVTRFFLKLQKVDLRKGKLTTLLYTMTRNKCIDQYRKANRTIRIDDFDSGSEPTLESDPLDELLNSETQGQIQWAVEQLTPESQLLFQKLVAEGKSAEEVAEELGIGITSVHNQKSRILRKLRQLLAPLSRDE